jgi:hypothetical protein
VIKRRKGNVGILRLCKTVYDEAAEVFYGENEFRFSAVNGQMVAAAFVHHIRKRHAKFIKTLAIGMPFWCVDRDSWYGTAWCVDSISGGERLLGTMPWSYPHKGACYYEKSFASLASGLVKAGNLKVLKLVLPDWFEYCQARGHVKLWQALDKIISGLPELTIEVFYMYQNDEESDSAFDPSYENLKTSQKRLLYELYQKGVDTFKLAAYEKKGRMNWEAIPCASRFEERVSKFIAEESDKVLAEALEVANEATAEGLDETITATTDELVNEAVKGFGELDLENDEDSSHVW